MNTSEFNFVFLGQSVLKYKVPLEIFKSESTEFKLVWVNDSLLLKKLLNSSSANEKVLKLISNTLKNNFLNLVSFWN